jgi:hypothetical protein
MGVRGAEGVLELADPICELGDLLMEFLGGCEDEPGTRMFTSNHEKRKRFAPIALSGGERALLTAH